MPSLERDAFVEHISVVLQCVAPLTNATCRGEEQVGLVVRGRCADDASGDLVVVERVVEAQRSGQLGLPRLLWHPYEGPTVVPQPTFTLCIEVYDVHFEHESFLPGHQLEWLARKV